MTQHKANAAPAGDVPENNDANDQPVPLKPLRVWPVVLLLAGMLIARWTMSFVDNGPEMLWMVPAFVPALCGILIFFWWIGISRARWKEKVGGAVALIAIIVVTMLIVHPSMRGPAVTVLTLPVGFAGFGLACIAQARRLTTQRTLISLLVAAISFGASGMLRAPGGLWGNFAPDLDWRWNPSPEELFLEEQQNQQADAASDLEVDSLANPEWPGFRGPDRTSFVPGVVLATDWDAQPPTELWKIRVGPAWSSFAVAGKRIFTQEQRGDKEAVVCYHADSGKQLWVYATEGRFDDPLGGPGPRATPTIAHQALFVMQPTGALLRLDAASGDPVWAADVGKTAQRKPPEWGFCSSPLVVDNLVIVHGGGENELGILAFNAETGDLQWSAHAGDHSYGSPQKLKLAGRDVVGMLTNQGLHLVGVDASPLLDHEWAVQGYRALQPHAAGNDRVLILTGMGTGSRLIEVNAGEGEIFEAETLWTEKSMKPDFSDCVIHDGHIYGIDGAVLACVNLETGKRVWKSGRYGKGQLLLLTDANLLLVLGEYGQLALVATDPEEHRELASIQALEGKTWNHPVLVGDRLYIRNSQEAACYELPSSEVSASESVNAEDPGGQPSDNDGANVNDGANDNPSEATSEATPEADREMDSKSDN